MAGWPLLPIALAAAACGGVWLPQGVAGLAMGPGAALAASVAGAAGLELLFRGLAPAGLPPCSGRARWSPWCCRPCQPGALSLLPAEATPWGGGGCAFAALLFGLVAGLARERAESIALPVVFSRPGRRRTLGRVRDRIASERLRCPGDHGARQRATRP
jgi:hypothetical protein